MTSRPRKGHHVRFQPDDASAVSDPREPITGLRFTLITQDSGKVLIDYTALHPRRLALSFARALRHFASPGGPLGVRSTVKAYAVTLPKFFDYLQETREPIYGPEDLRASHVDGFEGWLDVHGVSGRSGVLPKVVAVLRQVAADMPNVLSADLRDRLRYVSAKPYQRPQPRDAYSPFVARQLRDAARRDIAMIIRRLNRGPTIEEDGDLQRWTAAAHAIIQEKGILGSGASAWQTLYEAMHRRHRPTDRLSEDLHRQHYLTAGDIVPFLVLLALDSGLEIECCKTLTVDCLQNQSGGTVEIAYLKRRARGAEHKRIRVRDGSSTTPGGLIRQLINLTAAARRHHPSEGLWVFYQAGALSTGLRNPRQTIQAWTRRHGIVDDNGRPFRLHLSRLRKTHRALWYLKTEGHMTRFAVGHTREVAARHYADVPALRPLHEATIAEAFEDAVAAALMPVVLTSETEAAWCANPTETPGELAGSNPLELLGGEQDVWLASCRGFYSSPHGVDGSPCPVPFWGCLECSNAVITARKLPAILAFLRFVEDQRRKLPASDWSAKFDRSHRRIVDQILPAFSDAVIAKASEAVETSPLYLPPEAHQ